MPHRWSCRPDLLPSRGPGAVRPVVPEVRIPVVAVAKEVWFGAPTRSWRLPFRPNRDFTRRTFRFSVTSNLPSAPGCADAWAIVRSPRPSSTASSARRGHSSYGIKHALLYSLLSTRADGTAEITSLNVADPQRLRDMPVAGWLTWPEPS